MDSGDELLDFNFWPSFADSMLAFVIILILLLIYVVFSSFTVGSSIREAQENVRAEIKTSYGGELIEVYERGSESRYVVEREGREELEIHTKLHLQRITFRGNVLFPQNSYRLSEEGKDALRTVGTAIEEQLHTIEEIQVEGHTDAFPTERYEEGNLELGALRAVSVFRFLQEDPSLQINPARNLMSVTSYGEYKPIGRQVGEMYNSDSLWTDNDTEAMRTRNRRIELLLLYKGGGTNETGLYGNISVKRFR